MYRPKYLDVSKEIKTVSILGEKVFSSVVRVGAQGKRGNPPKYDADRYKRKYGKAGRK